MPHIIEGASPLGPNLTIETDDGPSVEVYRNHDGTRNLILEDDDSVVEVCLGSEERAALRRALQ